MRLYDQRGYSETAWFVVVDSLILIDFFSSLTQTCVIFQFIHEDGSGELALCKISP